MGENSRIQEEGLIPREAVVARDVGDTGLKKLKQKTKEGAGQVVEKIGGRVVRKGKEKLDRRPALKVLVSAGGALALLALITNMVRGCSKEVLREHEEELGGGLSELREMLGNLGMDLGVFSQEERSRLETQWAYAEIDTIGLIAGTTQPQAFLRRFVLSSGLESERVERLESLGIDPSSFRGKDMDVVFDDPDQWNLEMRFFMVSLDRLIQEGKVIGVTPVMGGVGVGGLEEYLINMYGDSDSVRKGGSLITSLYNAYAMGVPLGDQDSTRLRDYVEQDMGLEWNSARGE